VGLVDEGKGTTSSHPLTESRTSRQTTLQSKRTQARGTGTTAPQFTTQRPHLSGAYFQPSSNLSRAHTSCVCRARRFTRSRMAGVIFTLDVSKGVGWYDAAASASVSGTVRGLPSPDPDVVGHARGHSGRVTREWPRTRMGVGVHAGCSVVCSGRGGNTSDRRRGGTGPHCARVWCSARRAVRGRGTGGGGGNAQICGCFKSFIG
jgi:hypothetical protein